MFYGFLSTWKHERCEFSSFLAIRVPVSLKMVCNKKLSLPFYCFAIIYCHLSLSMFLNPSCNKAFGTHTLYQGRRGAAAPPCYLNNLCPQEHEILYGIRDVFKRPRNAEVSYIVINWLP